MEGERHDEVGTTFGKARPPYGGQDGTWARQSIGSFHPFGRVPNFTERPVRGCELHARLSWAFLGHFRAARGGNSVHIHPACFWRCELFYRPGDDQIFWSFWKDTWRRVDALLGLRSCVARFRTLTHARTRAEFGEHGEHGEHGEFCEFGGSSVAPWPRSSGCGRVQPG